MTTHNEQKVESTELPEDIKALGYEEARDELYAIVRALESNQGGLEESIAQWERGELLARRCQEWLDGARDRLNAAIERQQGSDSSESQ